MINQEEFPDITSNIKNIEWLKCEILSDITSLYSKLSYGYSEESSCVVGENISAIVAKCYLLAKRLGIPYEEIDIKLEGKLQAGLLEKTGLEEKYGDISDLLRYINVSKTVLCKEKTAGEKI
jgi:hypothetical protein